ncbi:MAG: hypothetical protein GF398_17725 [Chitinivibrionales bacterium]|nr:hypothetical protein [Chitinivibrionales bacterium]
MDETAPTTGTINGYIRSFDGSGLKNELVVIYGTNFWALTDSSGHFRFYHIPEGNYSLAVGDTAIAVFIAAGDTVALPSIYFNLSQPAPVETVTVDTVINQHLTVSRRDTIILQDAAVIRDTIATIITDTFVTTITDTIVTTITDTIVDTIALIDSNHIDSIELDDFGIYDGLSGKLLKNLDNIDNAAVYFMNSDSISLRFTVVKQSGDPHISALPLEVPVELKWNGVTLYDAPASKGRVHTALIARSSLDTISIRINGKEFTSFHILDSIYIDSVNRNFLYLTTGDTPLLRQRYGATPYFAVFAGDTFWIDDANSDSIDWDIFIVNQNDDTCSWRHSNPDWGIAGQQHDDPAFSGDSYQSSTTSGITYDADKIQAQDLPNGAYKVYVRFNDGPASIAQAVPQLSIGIGLFSANNRLHQFYTLEPEVALKKGYLWYAGTLSMPEHSFDPSSQHIIPANQ